MGRPKNTHETIPVEFAASAKLIHYLDELQREEGFGSSRAEIARTFVWKEVNRLIETGRLKPQ